MLKEVAFGIALGSAYGLAGYLNFLWAMRRNGASFMVVAFGGILVRMTIALLLVAGGVLLWDMRETPFFLAFLSTFAVALTLEVAAMHRGWGTGNKADRNLKTRK